jgi:predicted dehydrogenase
MASDRPVRIGFVGVGAMGQCAHLRNYAALPDCEVVAIAEIRRKTAERVAQKYGVPAVYDDFRDMFARESLDAVVCSQPFQRHAVLIPQLLEYGKPLFIEKPLAGSLEAGERLLSQLRDSGVWVMVGYHKRSDPATMHAWEEVRRLRETGELGRLKYVRITMPAGDWVANGFWDLVDEGDACQNLETEPAPTDLDADGYAKYVEFVNYYIHQVNLLRHFLGAPYHVSFADPSGVVFAAMSDEDVPGLIEMSPYVTTLDWQETVLVAFERGYVKVELPSPMALNRPGRVEVFSDPGNGAVPRVVRPQMPWDHAMRRQAMNFMAAVRGERPPMCTAEEALEDLRVAREYLRLWKGL